MTFHGLSTDFVAHDKAGNVLLPHGLSVPGVESLIDPRTGNVQPLGLSGYTLAMSEEFGDPMTVENAGLGMVKFRPTGKQWATWYPDWPRFNAQVPGGNHTNTNQLSYYATSKVSVSDGTLKLKADQETTVPGLSYTSGMITSHPSFTPAYGFFESRLRLSAQLSHNWPAWWMSASAYDVWPPEIDIWEYFGNGTDYLSNVFRRGAPSDLFTFSGGPPVTEWHTWGCHWGPDVIRFYRDGVLVRTSSLLTNPGEPMYLMLNNGCDGGATFPTSTMEVDYVRAWTL